MNIDNFIVISDFKKDEISQILKQWIALYKDQLKTDFDFEVYKKDSDSYIVLPSTKLDFDLFNFLINYLIYPENFDENTKVVGYSFNNSHEDIPKAFLDKDFFVYVPDNDTDGDNVYAVTTDNSHLKIDFGGDITSISKAVDYISPNIDFSLLCKSDIIRTNSDDIERIIIDTSNTKIKKRYNILSTATLILILLTPLLALKDSHTFSVGLFALGYAIGFWFYSDYKMLRINQFYFKSLLVASLWGLFGYLTTVTLKLEYNLFIYVGLISPLWFLIIQRPLRFLFKRILKREPKIGNHDVEGGDKIYSLILFLSLFVLPFLIIIKYAA